MATKKKSVKKIAVRPGGSPPGTTGSGWKTDAFGVLLVIATMLGLAYLWVSYLWDKNHNLTSVKDQSQIVATENKTDKQPVPWPENVQCVINGWGPSTIFLPKEANVQDGTPVWVTPSIKGGKRKKFLAKVC